MKTQTSHFPLPFPAFHFASFAWPRYVATLPRDSKAKRLERYKKPFCGPSYQAPKPENAGKGTGFYHESSGCPFRLRWSYCDEVARINHTGWFCDEYQDSKIRGLVFRLPKSRGFMAGWTMGEGMASSMDCDIYETELEAARAADSMAESAAETEREYQEKYEAERLAEEEREEAERIAEEEREEAEDLTAALCSAE
jgi:hypothetical protein